MGFKHIDRYRKETELKNLKLPHLKNIISFIEKKAKVGYTVVYGSVRGGADEVWGDAETYYGKDARKKMNYKHYAKELKRREL